MTMTNTFESLSLQEAIAEIKPKPATSGRPAESPLVLEELAKGEGFALDNRPVMRKVLKGGRVAAKDKAQPMTLRIRVPDWNKFSAFCERKGYTVAEGFEKLAGLADQIDEPSV